MNYTDNRFMVCDQRTERITVYNGDRAMASGNLDEAEEWSFPAGHTAGLKYREKTVFGDVLLIAGVDSRIVTYPGGETLWQTREAGNNYHSVEILPSGNLLLADSCGLIRLFSTAALLQGGAVTCTDYALYGAHGVLWDPAYGCLWGLGNDELVRYRVQGEGASETLTVEASYSLSGPLVGGHDLAADLTDLRYLYLTCNMGVVRFDKEAGVFQPEFPHHEAFPSSYMKGIGNTPEGTFFFCFVNGGKGRVWENWRKAEWLTDRICCAVPDGAGGLSVRELISEQGAFYKCRTFYGDYQ